MKIHSIFYYFIIAVLVGCGFWHEVSAQEVRAVAPTTAQSNPTYTYVTGGVGADEERTLQAEAKDYDLHITNADMDGHFTAETNLVIRKKNGGETVIQAGNTGPLFFAKLPIGEYVLQATNGDKIITKDVKISADRATDLQLIWKPS